MRVLHVLNEINLSGMEVMLINSYDYWKELGVENQILSIGLEKGTAYDEMINTGFRVHFILSNSGYFHKLREIVKIIRQEKIQVVHIHSERAFFLSVLAGFIGGTQLTVRSFHSIFRPTSILGRLRRKFERKAARLFRVKYLSVSNSVRGNEFEKYKTESDVIFNWYNNKKFFIKSDDDKQRLRKLKGVQDGQFVICSVGNCSPIKRHGLILESLSLLPEECDWVYLHVGREEPEFPERKFAQKKGISSRCRFLGVVDEVESVLNMADVFLMTSKVEGLGNSALEALACGVPTILTRSPGLIDLIDLVGDIRGVSDRPREIAENIMAIYRMGPAERRKLSDGLAESARLNFSQDKGVKAYLAVYNRHTKSLHHVHHR